MLQGVSNKARQRQILCAPNFLQGVTLLAQKCHHVTTLKGVNEGSQKCRFHVTPTSFIWCQLRIAVMPLEQRTKGRDNLPAQKCQTKFTLPNQFNGVIVKTQKCLDIVAPREGPCYVRSNANRTVPFPPVTGGQRTRTAMSLIELPHLIWAI